MSERQPIDTAIAALARSIAEQTATLQQLKRERDEIEDRQRLAEQAPAADQTPVDEQDFPPGDLISTADAAIRYRVSPDTVRGWCENRGIGIKPHGRWLVSNKRVRRMLGYG